MDVFEDWEEEPGGLGTDRAVEDFIKELTIKIFRQVVEKNCELGYFLLNFRYYRIG